MIRYGLAVVVGLASMPVGAEEFDAARLYGVCEHHDPSSSENAVCLWYVRGLIEGMLFGSLSSKVSAGYCPPSDGVSVEQGRLILDKFMRDNPAMLHQKAGVIAGAALLAAFPCKKSN